MIYQCPLGVEITGSYINVSTTWIDEALSHVDSATCTKMRGGLALGVDLHTCVSSLHTRADYVSFNEYRNAYINPADIRNHFLDMGKYNPMQTILMVFEPIDAAQSYHLWLSTEYT